MSVRFVGPYQTMGPVDVDTGDTIHVEGFILSEYKGTRQINLSQFGTFTYKKFKQKKLG